MATQELLRDLINPLSELLQKSGSWKYVKTRQRFERKIDGGMQVILVDYKSWVEVISVWIIIKVRLDAVEDAMNEFHDFMEDKDKKHTTTIGIQWGKLEGDWMGWKECDIFDADSGELCALKFYHFLLVLGFDFMDKYSDPQNVFELTKMDDDLASSCSGTHERGQYAVLLAHMLGHDEEIPNIIQAKIDAFSKFDTDRWVNKLEKFVEQFKMRHPSVII